MKSLAPSLRELARLIGRQTIRFRLWLDRRKLARLETALGLLGWQQAEYDEPTQAHVNRLIGCEREQARLTNESAALVLEIQKIEEQRGVAERELAQAEAAALEKEQPAAGTLATLEAQLAALRKERKTIAARLPVLDRELAAAEEEYRTLVPQDMRAGRAEPELLRLRKVILALPREKSEWQAKLGGIDGRISGMEALRKSIGAARAAFDTRAREWADEIAGRQRAKRKIEKEIEIMERAKTNPYREIGRVLADYGIAPLNQPDALAAVLTQRDRIASREAALLAIARP